MKKVFVIGRISDSSHVQFLRNIRAGIITSARLLRAGFNVSCPFLDYQYILAEDESIPLETLRAICLDEVRRADLILAIKGWERSPNCCIEVVTAENLGMRVYKDVETLIENESTC